ncbi:MAG: PEGA domain-containing protein [Polyangiaceae bacterium]
MRSKANLRLCEKACPAALSSDCAAWSRELDALVPTVVIEVAGVDGASISDAKVFIDDVEQDAATPIELDPGAHRVRVSAPGFADAADALELAPGAHVTRSIRLVPTTREQPSLLGPALVMGGGGLLLLVAGALSIAGHVDVSKMRSTCAPTCDPERVDAVEMMWIAGGIAGGTGGLMALLGGVWLGVKLSAGVSSESASAALTVQF